MMLDLGIRTLVTRNILYYKGHRTDWEVVFRCGCILQYRWVQASTTRVSNPPEQTWYRTEEIKAYLPEPTTWNAKCIWHSLLQADMLQ